METGVYFFCSVEVMKRRENIKVVIRPIDSITILHSLLEKELNYSNELLVIELLPTTDYIHLFDLVI